MASYRIDAKGRFHTSKDVFDRYEIIMKLMDSERFREGVRIAYDLMGHTSFIIAGGFLRDQITERTVKDLDIFTKNAERFPNRAADPKSYSSDNESQGSIIDTIYFNKHGEKVNLSLVPDLSKLIDRFPVNLSKIGYHSNGTFIVPLEFMIDVNRKTLTQGDPKYANEKYFERLKEKYPDYQWKPRYGLIQ